MKYILLATLLVSACGGGVTSPAPVQQPSTSVPVRVGGNIPAPTKTKDVLPIYPSEALQARVSGIVILEAIIGEDGKMRSVTVIRSVPLLDQAAVNAVMQWEYTPTLVNGAAVPVVMTVTVNFMLQ